MSKLDDLIKELCPNGVEYYIITELVDTYIGLVTTMTKHYSDTGARLIYNSNIKEGRFEFKEKKCLNESFANKHQHKMNVLGDIITVHTGDVGTSAIIDDELVGSIGFATITSRVKDTTKTFNQYLCCYLNSQKCKKQIVKMIKGDRDNLNLKDFNKLIIPLPPLPVQEEIVRILDTFTELTAKLTAELTAELTARKKQYEYYRDSLLTFGDEVKWKDIESVFYFKNGYTPSKSKSEYWKDGTVPWFRMEDIRENGRILDKSIQCVNMLGVKNEKLFKADSIIVATSATIGEHALITTEFLANQRFTVMSLKEDYQNKYNIKFVYYYCFLLDEWCKKNTTLSSFASVDMSALKKYPIPVPPLEEQQRIVDILDRFDTLCNDISNGLPAEIKARQRQYEYYRDKLLTFPNVKEEV